MRSAGQIKMGYYPTPPGVVDRLKKLLASFSSSISALDPCCGDGEALASLTEGLRARTYGVELDHQRAAQASRRLHKVVRCDYLSELEASREAFDLILLNPPYDRDAEGRTEARFLARSLPLLRPKGVLVLVVQAETLARDQRLQHLILTHLKNPQMVPFPDDEFRRFRQVVIMGAKHERPRYAGEDDGHLGYYARRVAETGRVPDMILQSSPLILPSGPRPATFKARLTDPARAVEAADRSPLWNDARALSREAALELERPPLPFRKGHLALLLACGLLDGVVGRGDGMMVVRGLVRKTSEVVRETTENGDTEEREIERFQVAVKTLDRSGRIEVLQ